MAQPPPATWKSFTSQTSPLFTVDVALACLRARKMAQAKTCLAAPNQVCVVRRINCIVFADDYRFHHHANIRCLEKSNRFEGCLKCRDLFLPRIIPALKRVLDHTIASNAPYRLQMVPERAGEGALTWKVKGPAGLSIDNNRGNLSWASPVAGSHDVKVSVSNAYGTDEVGWKLTVKPHGPPAAAPSLATAPVDLARWWRLSTKDQRKAAIERAERIHRNEPVLVRAGAPPASSSARDPAIQPRQYGDLVYLQEAAEIWGRRYDAIRAPGAAGRPGPLVHYIGVEARTSTVDQVFKAIKEASRDGLRPINVVVFGCHGITSEVIIGQGLGPRGFNALLDKAKDFLARDVKFIFYACLTAGDCPTQVGDPDWESGTYPGQAAGQPAGRGSIAQQVCEKLRALGKSQAEVWGHVGWGDGFARPYWRRFRARDSSVLTLFDYCFPPEIIESDLYEGVPLPAKKGESQTSKPLPRGALGKRRKEIYIRFTRILNEAFRSAHEDAGTDPHKGTGGQIAQIPMWPLDLEEIDLPGACQKAWRSLKAARKKKPPAQAKRK